MAVTFWTLFFFVLFLMVAVVVFVFSILDGIRYHEDMKRQNAEKLANVESDRIDGDD